MGGTGLGPTVLSDLDDVRAALGSIDHSLESLGYLPSETLNPFCRKRAVPLHDDGSTPPEGLRNTGFVWGQSKLGNIGSHPRRFTR